MKHNFYIFAVVLSVVLALVLVGCSNAQSDETTAPPADAGQTKIESKLYWNLEQGKAHTPGSDGNYTVQFLCDGKIVSLKVSGEALVKAIEKMNLMGLVMDDKGVVTDYVSLLYLPYERVTWDYTVISVSSSEIKTNATKLENGKEVILKPSSTTMIMDVSEDATALGATMQIEAGNTVTAVADEQGNITHIFVTAYAAKIQMDVEVRYCDHCKKDMEFTMWSHTDSLPNQDGHYCLTKDVTMDKATTISAQTGMCLDLNGKTVTQTSGGIRLYTMAKAVVNLMDSVGTGVMIPATTSKSAEHVSKWGMIFEINSDDAILRIYSGTLDGSGKYAQYGNCINLVTGRVEMYGGTLKGGIAYGSGSAAIRVGGVFDMYGGTIIGGKNEHDGVSSVSGILGGGAVGVSVGATFNMYGGEIVGGESSTNAGGVRVDGFFNMSGGSISGGKCQHSGGGVYVRPGGSVVLSGDARIIDNEGSNIYFASGTNLTIKDLKTGDSGAKIGIGMEKIGVMSQSVVPEDALSCFGSDQAGLTITRDADGHLVLG